MADNVQLLAQKEKKKKKKQRLCRIFERKSVEGKKPYFSPPFFMTMEIRQVCQLQQL